MTITSRSDAQKFIASWSERGPMRQAWVFNQIAESQRACAILATVNGQEIAARGHSAAADELTMAVRRLQEQIAA